MDAKEKVKRNYGRFCRNGGDSYQAGVREFLVVSGWCSVWVKVDDGIVIETADMMKEFVGKSYSSMFCWIDRKSNGKVRVIDLQNIEKPDKNAREHRFYKDGEM